MSARVCTDKLGGSRVFLFLPLNPNTMKAEKSLIEELCALKTKGKFLSFLKTGLQAKEYDAYALTLPESSLIQHVIVSGSDLVLIKIGQEHRGAEVIANDYGTFYPWGNSSRGKLGKPLEKLGYREPSLLTDSTYRENFSLKDAEAIILKIINVSKKLGKKVIAVSDGYYLDI